MIYHISRSINLQVCQRTVVLWRHIRSRYLDPSPRLCKLESVALQVYKDLLEPLFVCEDGEVLAWHEIDLIHLQVRVSSQNSWLIDILYPEFKIRKVVSQADAFLLGVVLLNLHNFLDCYLDVYHFFVPLKLSGLYLSQSKDVFHMELKQIRWRDLDVICFLHLLEHTLDISVSDAFLCNHSFKFSDVLLLDFTLGNNWVERVAHFMGDGRRDQAHELFLGFEVIVEDFCWNVDELKSEPLRAVFCCYHVLLYLKKPIAWHVLNVETFEDWTFLQSLLNLIVLVFVSYQLSSLVLKHKDSLAQVVILVSKHVHDWVLYNCVTWTLAG